MKFNSARTPSNKISSTIASKINRFNKPAVTGAKKAVHDVNHLARRLKSRLSNAAKNLFGSDAIDKKQQESVVMPPSPQSSSSSPPQAVLDTSLPSTNSLPAPESGRPSTSTATSSLADDHWLEERKPALRNMGLLKQYLTFISQEVTSLDFEEEVIKMSFPDASNLPTQQNETAKLAATLIEQHVLASNDISLSDYHYATTASYLKGSPKKASGKNRRRGRPSKSLQCDITKPLQRKQQQQRKKRQELKKKQEKQQAEIACICNSSDEESGTMVQCDDCLNWLHLDCLGLDESALGDTFRCPSCFIRIDREDDTKLISGLTWRYAARHKSEEIACYKPMEEDEDEYDFDHRITIDHTTSSLGIVMDYDLSFEHNDEYDSIPSPEDFPSLIPPPYSPAASPTMSFNDPWDLSFSSSASQYSQHEVHTPPEYMNKKISWLAPPCAGNVFLCQNDTKPTAALPRSSSPLPTPDTPSVVCAQELPEFNFWEINHSPLVAPTAESISSCDEIPDFDLWEF